MHNLLTQQYQFTSGDGYGHLSTSIYFLHPGLLSRKPGLGVLKGFSRCSVMMAVVSYIYVHMP